MLLELAMPAGVRSVRRNSMNLRTATLTAPSSRCCRQHSNSPTTRFRRLSAALPQTVEMPPAGRIQLTEHANPDALTRSERAGQRRRPCVVRGEAGAVRSRSSSMTTSRLRMTNLTFRFPWHGFQGLMRRSHAIAAALPDCSLVFAGRTRIQDQLEMLRGVVSRKPCPACGNRRGRSRARRSVRPRQASLVPVAKTLIPLKCCHCQRWVDGPLRPPSTMLSHAARVPRIIHKFSQPDGARARPIRRSGIPAQALSAGISAIWLASPTGTAGKSLRFRLSRLTSVVSLRSARSAHGFVSSAFPPAPNGGDGRPASPA